MIPRGRGRAGRGAGSWGWVVGLGAAATSARPAIVTGARPRPAEGPLKARPRPVKPGRRGWAGGGRSGLAGGGRRGRRSPAASSTSPPRSARQPARPAAMPRPRIATQSPAGQATAVPGRRTLGPEYGPGRRGAERVASLARAQSGAGAILRASRRAPAPAARAARPRNSAIQAGRSNGWVMTGSPGYSEPSATGRHGAPRPRRAAAVPNETGHVSRILTLLFYRDFCRAEPAAGVAHARH